MKEKHEKLVALVKFLQSPGTSGVPLWSKLSVQAHLQFRELGEKMSATHRLRSVLNAEEVGISGADDIAIRKHMVRTIMENVCAGKNASKQGLSTADVFFSDTSDIQRVFDCVAEFIRQGSLATGVTPRFPDGRTDLDAIRAQLIEMIVANSIVYTIVTEAFEFRANFQTLLVPHNFCPYRLSIA